MVDTTTNASARAHAHTHTHFVSSSAFTRTVIVCDIFSIAVAAPLLTMLNSAPPNRDTDTENDDRLDAMPLRAWPVAGLIVLRGGTGGGAGFLDEALVLVPAPVPAPAPAPVPLPAPPPPPPLVPAALLVGAAAAESVGSAAEPSAANTENCVRKRRSTCAADNRNCDAARVSRAGCCTSCCRVSIDGAIHLCRSWRVLIVAVSAATLAGMPTTLAPSCLHTSRWTKTAADKRTPEDTDCRSSSVRQKNVPSSVPGRGWGSRGASNSAPATWWRWRNDTSESHNTPISSPARARRT